MRYFYFLVGLMMCFSLALPAFAASLAPDNKVYESLPEPQGLFTATPGNSCYFWNGPGQNYPDGTYEGEQTNCNGTYFIGGLLFSFSSGDFGPLPAGTFGSSPGIVRVIEAAAGECTDQTIAFCEGTAGYVNTFTIQYLLAPIPPFGIIGTSTAIQFISNAVSTAGDNTGGVARIGAVVGGMLLSFFIGRKLLSLIP